MASSSSITGRPRPRILAILQREGSVTVETLAGEIGLSSTTIRRHLDILQREQLVSFDQIHGGSGRPEYGYFLTEIGHESGHRDYRGFLVNLLNEISGLSSDDLAKKDGTELLGFLIGRIAEQASWPYMQPNQATFEARVANLDRALSDRGFSPEITEKDGQVSIRLCNCPFRSVAISQETVCLFDRFLIGSILGSDPVLESSIHDGHTTCQYVIKMQN